MTQLALIVFKALNAFNLECSLSSERVFAVIICMFFSMFLFSVFWLSAFFCYLHFYN